MALFDLNDAFFKPLWIRVAIVLVTALWGIFEFSSGSPLWGVLFCGLSAYAVHGFFIVFDPREPDKKRDN